MITQSNFEDDTFNFNDDQYSKSKSFIIDNCFKCNFTFNVKIKGITVNSCKKCNFVVKEGLVASLEFINSKNGAVQCDKK